MSAKSKKSRQPATAAKIAPNPSAFSFSLKEAAAITGIALWAIRSAIWGRKLPAHVIGKRQIVLRADLENWIAGTPSAHGRKAAAA
jgi:acyl CoA:acetate/3-ketoacid CoA transferase beta subunit